MNHENDPDGYAYYNPEPRWWQVEWWRERINIQRHFCVVFGWRLW